MGIQPDILVCRADRPIGQEIREKIARFCNVATDCVIENTTAPSLYAIPLMLEQQGLCRAVCRRLGLADRTPDLSAWEALVEREQHPKTSCTIAVVGKYVQLQDAYLSITEALRHGGIGQDAQVHIQYVDAETVTEDNAAQLLAGVQGILIPGGFGNRGLDGKLAAIHYARTHRAPLLGICLGMQMAVVEFARHVLGYQDAHSSEADPATTHPVIDLMPDQVGNRLGGTLRLGAYPWAIQPGTLAHRLYGKSEILERHRHRYEFNNAYRIPFQEAGMVFSGINPQRNLVEIAELPDHPFFIGVQFHPEFQSRPDRPHPLFLGFVAAALAYGQKGR